MAEPGIGIEKLMQEAKYAVLDTRTERGILQEISTLGGEIHSRLAKENNALREVSEGLASGVKSKKDDLEVTRKSSAALREEADALTQERQARDAELETAQKRRRALQTSLSEIRAQGTELVQNYQETVCERERAYLKNAWLKYQMYTAVTGIRWDEEADGERGYISLDGLVHFDLRKHAEEGTGRSARNESSHGRGAADHSAGDDVHGADYLWEKIAEAAQ